MLLEGIALQSYILILLNFTLIASEIVLKYFLLGNFISALLIYSLSLFYGGFNTLNLLVLKELTAIQYLINPEISSYVIYIKIALLLVLISLFFKLGSFPLHF